MKIIYQKRNGEIFGRIRNTYFPYRVGETTSMGWKVIDILYKHKNNYYHSDEYDRLVEKEWQKSKRILQIKKATKHIFTSLMHTVMVFVLMKILELLSYNNIALVLYFVFGFVYTKNTN